MSRFLAMTKRELLAYFFAPVPYLVMFLFLAMTFIFAERQLQQRFAQIDYLPIFQWLDFGMLFLMPLLTMNTIAEERSKNTLETLLTAPVSEWQVVLSKWLATLVFCAAMLAPTLIYWVVFLVLGRDKNVVDAGPILSAYLGVMLLGGLYVAIGIFASSLTENGPLSAFLAFCVMLLLMIGEVFFSESSSDFARTTFTFISQRGHFLQFLLGRIPTHDVVYFAMMTTLFLFLAVRAIESRKWR